jgi:hypothetical protein
MTRNRTAVDLFTLLGAEIMALLLVALAGGLAVSRFLSGGRERMRRVEVKLRRRAARRSA